MTTLTFDKNIEDIEEPTLLPEDWYIFRVTEPPKIEDNKAKKDKKTYSEGAGKNLIISLRSVSENPEHSGRAFKLYLPYPVAEDMENYDGRGMMKYDAKLERIADFAEKATGCSAEGNEITILPNALIGIYVTQALDQQGEKPINNLDWFQGFRSPDEITENLPSDLSEDSFPDPSNEDVPF